ncbi:Ras-related protein RABA4b [Oopsacas minuta]|uniref:Ras-related protein RABA4b n=1 Tax=Oopsacas minuta TaxID=111878 RepID=A0AAV7JT66_9METZ|nr:Ras-related protein RABA4b [Oopsacas minuta]
MWRVCGGSISTPNPTQLFNLETTITNNNMATSECLKLDNEVQIHYSDIVKAKCAATPWKIFTFGEEDHSTLLFLEEGSSLNDFKANLSSDKVLFGLLRIADNKPANLKGKLILVYWCGQNSEAELRTETEQLYKSNGEVVFSKCERFISIESLEELEMKLKVILTSKEHKRIDSIKDKNSTLDNISGGKGKNKYKSKRKGKAIRESSVLDEGRDSMTPDNGSGDELVFPAPTSATQSPVEDKPETKGLNALERILATDSISYANVEKMKVIIVGDCQVGKTHLLHTYVYGKSKKYHPQVTVGVDHLYRVVNTDINKPIKLELWDTSGEERYRALASVWYRHAVGAMVVFDLTDADSLDSIPNWIESINRYTDCKAYILVGNKNDLIEQRKVDHNVAKKIADQNGMIYVETSAIFGVHVDDAFNVLANELVTTKLVETPPAGPEEEILIINLESELPKKKKKEKCCHK